MTSTVKCICLSVVAACLLALGTVTSAPVSAETFGVPASPSNISAVATPAGLKVTWTPSPAASPVITHYVVHAGPNSCPVTVPASATSAVMPYIKGPSSVVPMVQAVNDYGFSANASGAPIKVPALSTPGFRNVQILGFSDLHGAIEAGDTSIGAAILSSAFATDRKKVKSTFVVSAGDNIGGSPVISSAFDEVPTIKALNLMNIDVSTFGNHEFDKPLSHLRSMIDLSTFPWVGSNITPLGMLKGKSRAATDVIVKDSGGVKVGFVGVDTADLGVRVNPANFVEGKQTLVIDDSKINAAIAKARAKGAEIVVALLHRGWNANANGKAVGPLMDSMPLIAGVDAAVGGDSHLQYASILSGIPVAEVPNSGQMYERTVICLDTRRKTTVGASIEFVTKAMLGSVPPDPAVAAVIDAYRKKLGDKLDVKIGTVSGVFPRGGNPAVERSGETPMGDFATDVIRSAYHTDLAIMSGGSIRDTFPAGSYRPADGSLRRPGNGTSGPFDVTLGDLSSVFPFSNNVSTSDITGAALWQALENGVSKYPADGRFPQISGFTFTFDPSRPSGSRVMAVTKADGTPIAPDGRRYSVATLDYMVIGGDGYGTLFDPVAAVMQGPYLDTLIAAFKADLAAGRVTKVPDSDGRITIR